MQVRSCSLVLLLPTHFTECWMSLFAEMLCLLLRSRKRCCAEGIFSSVDRSDFGVEVARCACGFPSYCIWVYSTPVCFWSVFYPSCWFPEDVISGWQGKILNAIPCRGVLQENLICQIYCYPGRKITRQNSALALVLEVWKVSSLIQNSNIIWICLDKNWIFVCVVIGHSVFGAIVVASDLGGIDMSYWSTNKVIQAASLCENNFCMLYVCCVCVGNAHLCSCLCGSWSIWICRFPTKARHWPYQHSVRLPEFYRAMYLRLCCMSGKGPSCLFLMRIYSSIC